MLFVHLVCHNVQEYWQMAEKIINKSCGWIKNLVTGNIIFLKLNSNRKPTFEYYVSWYASYDPSLLDLMQFYEL